MSEISSILSLKHIFSCSFFFLRKITILLSKIHRFTRIFIIFIPNRSYSNVDIYTKYANFGIFQLPSDLKETSFVMRLFFNNFDKIFEILYRLPFVSTTV